MDRHEERARLVEMRIATTATPEEWRAAIELFDRPPETAAVTDTDLDREFAEDMAAFGFDLETPP
jgi:hypothetical protein